MKYDKIGVCVIGAGRAGLIHAVNFAKGIKHARLTAIVEPNSETARQACRELELEHHYPDYRQALEDDAVDAVVVVTPTDYHRDIVVAYLHIAVTRFLLQCDHYLEVQEKG